MSRGERGAFVKEWRTAFFWLAKAERIPALGAIEVEVVCVYRNGHGWLDLGSAFPSVKAAVDGLVDAGVIVDDKHGYLTGMTFRPSRLGPRMGLELKVRQVPLARG